MSENSVGRISQVLGAVVDVRFDGDLPNILNALEKEEIEVHIDPAIAARARVSVERMLTGWTPGK